MIRQAVDSDFEAIWPLFYSIVSDGLTYTWSPETTYQQAKALWMEQPQKTFVHQQGQVISGSYFIKRNFSGAASHICNCGYMVAADARGQGIATEMCEHSQRIAIELGYRAMQFNCVVESNRGAIRLWKKLGFSTVGRIPRGFNHPNQGYIDMLIMYKWLVP